MCICLPKGGNYNGFRGSVNDIIRLGNYFTDNRHTKIGSFLNIFKLSLFSNKFISHLSLVGQYLVLFRAISLMNVNPSVKFKRVLGNLRVINDSLTYVIRISDSIYAFSKRKSERIFIDKREKD